jgi:cephalosporin hydroxylase
VRFHFYDRTNLANVIDKLQPSVILEMGCGNFEHMLCLLTYMNKVTSKYNVIGISDNECYLILPQSLVERFNYIRGVSYNILRDFKRLFSEKLDPKFLKPIGLAIVDTDHNYYTAKKELDSLLPLLDEKCCIAFHDTNNVAERNLAMSFRNLNSISNSTYEAFGYKDGSKYPLEEIKESFHLGIYDAINEFLEEHKDFKQIFKTTDSCGVIMIGRNFTI